MHLHGGTNNYCCKQLRALKLGWWRHLGMMMAIIIVATSSHGMQPVVRAAAVFIVPGVNVHFHQVQP